MFIPKAEKGLPCHSEAHYVKTRSYAADTMPCMGTFHSGLAEIIAPVGGRGSDVISEVKWRSLTSVGDYLAECPCVALGQVPFMKIRNIVWHLIKWSVGEAT